MDYVDVSLKQIIGVSAALIPFLEHDDANRALMGSNMQRQAVPLLIPEVLIVGTGMEKAVAQNSNMPIFAKRAGTVEYVDSRVIIVGDDEYHREVPRHERAHDQNHCPVVEVRTRPAGQLLADGASTGRSSPSARTSSWCHARTASTTRTRSSCRSAREGRRLPSIHIEEYEVEIRGDEVGKEEFTRDIPNVEKALSTEGGIVRIGTFVEAGDVLVGKVAPKRRAS